MALAIHVNFVGQKEPKKILALQKMGKARKYAKGQSLGFVPDYRHAVENMAESEGFGCSGGIDTEMTLSEDSRAPKRKCISLNGDGYSSCGILKEVLPLSKMSRSDRKDLIFRLKMDLERVQDLRKKLASISSDIVLLSPHSDIHSCSDGSKRPPAESLARSVSSQGKRRGPLHNNMLRSKKGPSGRSASARLEAPTSFSIAMVMKEGETLLNRLMSHNCGWPFLSPVDPVTFNIPDYFTIIKHPMDLGTIKNRLCRGEYSSPSDFAADVRLTFSNSMTYNPPGNQYHSMAQTLSKYFETRWKSIEKKIPTIEQSVARLDGTAYLNSVSPAEILLAKKEAAVVNHTKLRMEPAKLAMTDDEKKKLRRELEALGEEIPDNILDILREQSASDGQTGEEEIEIDIDALSDEILFKLRKLLDDDLTKKNKSQEKGKPCEMKIVHDSGLSNSPAAQPSKGDGLIDEDVDIVGGNDLPVSSYPHLKMERDAICRNNECNSSSSSASESGSSSSGTDSSSSSGSESDTVKASNPTGAKDEEELGVTINRKHDGGDVEEIVNHPLNELDQVEQDFEDKPNAVGTDGRQDEETAPSERQISPGKLYRAALLKNRFADTILKAREKALDKGEKGDPEKLRIEREELERRLREEKARLQAEAKAAEEARRKADAEAAAKVRRKREQEREAARLALQKMEKTVEINENSRFLAGLEMLRAAQGDQLPNFLEEMSPVYSENMLGSFEMQGNSNPLEQLGLYMKMDEDEDEEEDAQPSVSQKKADEQPDEQNGGETQSLVFSREEQDDHSPSESEEGQPLNQNKGDEQPVEQIEGEKQPLILNREEEDDHSLSGSEEGQPLNQKERDEQPLNRSQGGERQAHDWNEGDEQLESAPWEQENDVVDKGEPEDDAIDKREPEDDAIDEGEQENDVEEGEID